MLSRAWHGRHAIKFLNSHFIGVEGGNVKCKFDGTILHDSFSPVQWELAHKKNSKYTFRFFIT